MDSSTDQTKVSSSPSRPRPLNPFAFGSETEGRFGLMLAAAILLAINAGYSLPILLLGDTPPLPKPPTFQGGDSPAQIIAENDRLFSESLSALGQSVIFAAAPVLGMAVVIGLAWWHYRGHPERLRRRKQLRPLRREDDPPFVDALHTLAHQAGLSDAPSFEMDSSTASDGQAFGLANQSAVRLGGRLRLAFRKAPEAARAIVLHEFAHIANKDVQPTYYAQSLWQALALILGLPLIAVIVWMQLAKMLGGDLTGVGLVSRGAGLMQVIVTFGMVFVIRASLLRVREVDADWRAALWGAREGLMGIFRSQPDQADSLWRRIWRLHPTPRQRLEALEQPEKLFRLGVEVPALAGFMLGLILQCYPLLFIVFVPALSSIAAVISYGLFGLALRGLQNAPASLIGLIVPLVGGITILLEILLALLMLIPMLFASYLIVRSVGVQVQREAVAEAVAGRAGVMRYVRLLWPAALITLGMQAGIIFTPLGVLLPVALLADPQIALINRIAAVGLNLGAGMAASGLIWLWLAALRFFARRMAGSHIGKLPPRNRSFIGLAVILLGIVLLPMLIAQVSGLGLLSASSSSGDIGTMVAIAAGSQAVGLVGFGLMVFGAWLWLTLSRAVFPPKCHHCKKQVHGGVRIGKACPHCGGDLTEWAYV